MKKVLAILIPMALLLSAIPVMAASNPTTRYKTTKQIVMRKKAGTKQKKVATIKKGKIVYLYTKTKAKKANGQSWRYVKYGKKKGWVQAKRIKKYSTADVGKFLKYIGMNRYDVEKKLGSMKKIGQDESGYVYSFKNCSGLGFGTNLPAYGDSNTIQSIYVLKSKTIKGVKMGMTRKQIISKLGKPKYDGINEMLGEWNISYRLYTNYNVNFYFETKQSKCYSAWINPANR